jgi:hypothetical protein
VDWLAGDSNRAAAWVDGELADLQRALRIGAMPARLRWHLSADRPGTGRRQERSWWNPDVARSPPQHSLDPRDQLECVERLGDEVVGAQPQAQDAVALAT